LGIFNRKASQATNFKRSIKHLTGLTPRNIKVYNTAFQHKSVANDVLSNNERLEFLGDAILSSVVANILFVKFPAGNEGFLTEIRSRMVSRRQLNDVGRKMGLIQLIRYNEADKTLNKSSMLGNCLEALIGAVYLDHNYLKTERFITRRVIQPYMDIDTLVKEEKNFKSRLIEWTQKNTKTIEFKEINNRMEGDKKVFLIGIFIDDQQVSEAEGLSKKSAEQRAAEIAMGKLEINGDF